MNSCILSETLPNFYFHFDLHFDFDFVAWLVYTMVRKLTKVNAATK